MLNATSFVGCLGHQANVEDESSAETITLFGLTTACLGMLANILAFSALFRASAPNRALRLGLLSLSVADCLIALSTAGMLAFSYHWSSSAHWSREEDTPLYRREWCANDIFRRLWSISTDANQFTLIFLAGQQFLTVRYPLRSPDGIAASKCFAVLGAMWTASIIMGFMETAVIAAASEGYEKVKLWPDKGTTRFCYQLILYDQVDNCSGDYEHPLGQDKHNRAFVAYGICLLIVDLTALAVSYGYTAAAVDHVVKSERLHRALDTAITAWRPDRRRVVFATLAVTLVCLICYMPLFVYYVLVELGCPSCANPIFFPALLSIVAVAPVADPVIYTFRLKAVHRRVVQTVACCRHPVATRTLLSKTLSKTLSNEDSPIRATDFVL